MPKEPTDVEVIARAAPYIRSIAAFVIFLTKRFEAGNGDHDTEVDDCYRVADNFLGRLKTDVTGEKEN